MHVVKLNKPQAYLWTIILSILIYFIGQLIFFANAKTVTAPICEIVTRRGVQNAGPAIVYYACYTAGDGKGIKVRVGSNSTYDEHYDYSEGDSISLRYMRIAPFIKRINNFKGLWLVPIFYYLAPLAFLIGLVFVSLYDARYLLIGLRPFKWKPIKEETGNYF